MSQVGFELQIADQIVPITGLDVEGASVGNSGHMTAHCGMKALQDAGIDLVALAIANPGDLAVNAFVTLDGVTTQLFGGEYVSGEYLYNQQAVTVHARDWSGPLIDQKRVLVNILAGNVGPLAPSEAETGGVSTQNQKLSQVVTAIAKQFSLTPDLRLAEGADPDIGTIFGDSNDTIITPTPQSLWGILTRLARDSGNVLYVTPQKHLVFGEAGAGLEPVALCYRVNPIPAGTYGAMGIDVVHNPRRNLTFRVVVLSYDHTNSTMTKGQAYVIGSNYSAEGDVTVHAGAWSGPAAEKITSAIGAGNQSKKNAVPVYTFHADGLTAAQAQTQATAIANDIAKRELIVKTSTRCIPTLQPSNPVTLLGQLNQEFLAHQYFVTQYGHKLRMPKGQGDAAIFDTSLTLLDRQPAGKGDATTKAAK